jgi:plasmid stabilization system protein ParE
MKSERSMDSNDYEIEVTNSAHLEIAETFEYIAETLFAPKAALSLWENIQKVYGTLKKSPYLYSVSDHQELAAKKIRRVVIGRYLLLYTVDDTLKTVFILHFVFGGRDYLNTVLN